jgi:hypothetical protein
MGFMEPTPPGAVDLSVSQIPSARADLRIARAVNNQVISTVIRTHMPDPPISDYHIHLIAQALANKIDEAAVQSKPRQRRREWILLLIGLIAGALLSIPVGIWVNSLS